MGQILGPDNIPSPVIASSTTLTMSSVNNSKPTRITVGGQQYKPAALITLNTATTGLNGLDAGTLAANTLYYVYAVVSNGVLGLVASTAAPAVGPAGFLVWAEIARFRTAQGGATLAAVALRAKYNPQDAVVTEWQQLTVDSSYLVNGTGVTINSSRNKLEWVRNGSNMVIRGVLGFNNASAGTDVGLFGIKIPGFSSGRTIVPNLSDVDDQYGTANISDGVNGIANEAQVLFVQRGSSNHLIFKAAQAGTLTANYYVKGTDVMDATGYAYIINLNNVVIPIAEWQGLYT